MPLAREEKQEIITGFATKEGDTGSPEVQVALLTERIKELTGHLRELPQGQSFAPRPPQARRPAPPPSRLSDEEGQRALSSRHRTARTPPLGVAAPEPRHRPGSCRISRPGPSRPTCPQVVSSSTIKEEYFPCLSKRSRQQFGGRTLTIETGKLARLAGGAVTVRYGDTMVLGTANRSDPRPGPRLLPADGRVRRADVRRGQDPGRLHQARGARLRGGHPGCPPDRPPDPPALPRGLQGRHPARHHGPLDGPGERARHPRHPRRVRRADDQRDPVRRPRRRRPDRPHRRRVRGQPDLQPAGRLGARPDRVRHPRRDHDGRGRRQAPAGGRHGRGDPVRPPRPAAAHRHPGAAPRGRRQAQAPRRIIEAGTGSVLDFGKAVDAGDEFVVVDVETTGTDPKMADLVEIAAVKVKGGKITDRWSTFVNPAGRSSATRCTASPTRTSRRRRQAGRGRASRRSSSSATRSIVGH